MKIQMKKILFILSLITIVIACKKVDITKYYFTTNEITETDTLGNLVGHIQTGDWTLKPLSAGDAFDQKVFANLIDGYNKSEKNDPRELPFNIKRYNQNCSLDTFTFKIVAFPNPVIPHRIDSPFGAVPVPVCSMHFNIETNLKIARSLMFYTNKIDAQSQEHYQATDSTIIRTLMNTGIVERDYILYYIIYTTDGCVFFCKGNIMGCKAI